MNEEGKQNNLISHRAGGSPLLCSQKMLVTDSSPECVPAVVGIAHSWLVGGGKGGKESCRRLWRGRYSLKQDHREGLHQAVEGWLRHTLGLAALCRKNSHVSGTCHSAYSIHLEGPQWPLPLEQHSGRIQELPRALCTGPQRYSVSSSQDFIKKLHIQLLHGRSIERQNPK